MKRTFLFGESFLVIFNDMWHNLLKVLLVLSVLLFVVGCATHPPSAVAFMTTKKQTTSQDTLKTNVQVGISLLALGSINVEQTNNNHSLNDELNAAFTIQASLRYGYLAYGFGFQMQCPFDTSVLHPSTLEQCFGPIYSLYCLFLKGWGIKIPIYSAKNMVSERASLSKSNWAKKEL